MIERVLAFSVAIAGWWCCSTLIAAAAWGCGRSRGCRSTPSRTSPTTRCRSIRVAPALSPIEVEKQVTFPVETALAGIPGLEYTRSLSRNGFSQVTAVFEERSTSTSRASRSTSGWSRRARSLPPGVEPRMGPIATGLGEIYMWTVEFAPPAERHRRPRRPAGLAVATAPTSRPRASACAATSSAPPTCARSRTGSSARSCEP